MEFTLISMVKVYNDTLKIDKPKGGNMGKRSQSVRHW